MLFYYFSLSGIYGDRKADGQQEASDQGYISFHRSKLEFPSLLHSCCKSSWCIPAREWPVRDLFGEVCAQRSPYIRSASRQPIHLILLYPRPLPTIHPLHTKTDTFRFGALQVAFRVCDNALRRPTSHSFRSCRQRNWRDTSSKADVTRSSRLRTRPES